MRKSLFLAMAAVVLLAGCSKESDGITNENGGNDTETNIDPDAVKINLGMKLPSAEVSPASRGAIIGDATWDEAKVGVFALAKNETFNGADLIWVNNNLSQRILDNVEGTIKVGTPTTVELKDGPYYYPMTLGMDFTFYGYHPRVATPVTDGESKVITAAYNISGQEDILWGRVVAPQITEGEITYEGYNARYFRKNTTAAVPSITFDHKLVQLNFKLKAGTGEDGTTDESVKVTVKSINVICQNRNVNLTVANKNLMNNVAPVPVEDGKITAVPVAGGSDFELSNPAEEFLLPLYSFYDNKNNVIYTGSPTTESANTPMPIGMPIMLPTPTLAIANATEPEAYYIKVELGVGQSQTLSTIMAVKAPEGFMPGYSYNITIVVNGLSEIKLEATLTAWKKGTDPGEVEIN